MRATIAWVGAASLAAVASAQPLIPNADFDAPDIGGWDPYGEAALSWTVHDEHCGFPNPSGSLQAVVANPGNEFGTDRCVNAIPAAPMIVLFRGKTTDRPGVLQVRVSFYSLPGCGGSLLGSTETFSGANAAEWLTYGSPTPFAPPGGAVSARVALRAVPDGIGLPVAEAHFDQIEFATSYALHRSGFETGAYCRWGPVVP